MASHRFALVYALIPLAFASATQAITIDFEELAPGLPAGDPGSFYNGSDGAGEFVSQGQRFQNTHGISGGFEFWDGWSYSKTSDTTTASFTNQYSAFPGSGAGGSDTYGVAFPNFTTGVSTLLLDQPLEVVSAEVTNTTYAALFMLTGDSDFPGDPFDAEDFLRLTVTGRDALGDVTGSVETYLADFRTGDAIPDFILTDWTLLDLSSLGTVSQLDFAVDISDPFAPAYFALDNLVLVPEPGTAGLLVLGLVALARSRR